MRSRLRRFAELLALAAGFALAWRLELWFIVVTMAAVAIALATYEHIGEGALARRAAACALHAPHGGDQSAFELTLAADLATTADADTNLVDAAVAQVERTIADPWRKALATERLELAKRLVADQDLPPPPALLSVMTRPRVQLVAAAATVVFMLVGATARQPLLFVPLTLSVAALGVSYGEARRRAALPRLLSEEAATLPPPTGSAMPEASVTAALSALAGGRIRVLDRAVAMVTRQDCPHRRLALHRLSEARRIHEQGRPRTLIGAGIAWGGIAAALVTASELVL